VSSALGLDSFFPTKTAFVIHRTES